MQKLLIILTSIIFILSLGGCKFIQVNTGGDEIAITTEAEVEIAKIASRHMGQRIAAKYLTEDANILTAIKLCDKIINEEDTVKVIALGESGLEYLRSKSSIDPILFEDLKSVAKLCGIDIEKITATIAIDVDYSNLVKELVAAFKIGLVSEVK